MQYINVSISNSGVACYTMKHSRRTLHWMNIILQKCYGYELLLNFLKRIQFYDKTCNVKVQIDSTKETLRYILLTIFKLRSDMNTYKINAFGYYYKTNKMVIFTHCSPISSNKTCEPVNSFSVSYCSWDMLKVKSTEKYFN